MVHILLIIVIMHYILLISFCTTKIFKFQISHSLKEIIMIIKIYHIITINIIQIIDRRIQTERERANWTKMDWMDQSRQSEPKYYVDVTQQECNDNKYYISAFR